LLINFKYLRGWDKDANKRPTAGEIADFAMKRLEEINKGTSMVEELHKDRKADEGLGLYKETVTSVKKIYCIHFRYSFLEV